MTVTTWSPVGDLAGAEIDRLNRMFDAVVTGAPLAGGAWVPPVDIFENASKDVVVKVELPGMRRDAIKVTFENHVLSIEGERTPEPVEHDRYHRVERGRGTFHRSFRFGATIDPARVGAAYQDGVLTVTLPQREDARPREIPVVG
jgi:HSP20 family protein